MSGKQMSKTEKDRELRVTQTPGKSRERSTADTAIDPAINAAVTVLSFAKSNFGSLGVTETYEALNDSVKAVKAGDMSGPEATLVAQVAALNSIFTELARRGAANMGEYIEASEKYMRLALKAQAQCRASIETLATIKNPPIIIARQANIANGPQQVNNGEPCAEKSENVPNKLLESDYGKRLDLGTASTPVSRNPEMVPVEAIDWA